MRQPKPKADPSVIRARLMAVACGREPLFPRPDAILVINSRPDRIKRALPAQKEGLRDTANHTVLAP